MNFKNLSFILSLALAACFFANAACLAHETNMHSREYGEAIKTARELMWKAITSGCCSGATIAIADEAHIVYAEGIGAADRATNRLVDINTRFNIGSTSKMFAAVAILLLVDEGKIALDEPVYKYIPEFKMKDPRYKNITVRMLFNHSSGLPGSHFYFGYKTDNGMHKLLIDSMAVAYLKHAPGAMQIYCNDGFTLAEMIVERVSGEKFMDFLSKRVFKPLDMKNTGTSVGEANAANAAEYYELHNAKKYPREVVMVYGAGGLSSTASDMCRFASSFSAFGKHILSDASIKEILSLQPTPFSNKLRGPQILNEFGWDYSLLPDYAALGIQVLAKSGGTSCYSTYVQTVPRYGVTVMFSVSGSIANLEEYSRPILDAVMKAKNIAIPSANPIEKPVQAEAIPQEMSVYEGFYTNGSNVVKLHFDEKNKKMELLAPIEEGPDAAKTETPVASFIYNNNYFYCFDKKMTVYFADIDGATYIVMHKMPNYGVDTLLYQKVDKLADPKKLAVEICGKKWIARSMAPYAITETPGVCIGKSYAELPGYINFDGLKKIESSDSTSIAATAFRDQSALELFDVNGEKWIKSSIFVYSSEDKARNLVFGVDRVVIKSEGYNEWLKVNKDAIVKFAEIPSESRIMAANAEKTLFDNLVDKGEVYVPKGSMIMFAGKPGDMFKIYSK